MSAFVQGTTSTQRDPIFSPCNFFAFSNPDTSWSTTYLHDPSTRGGERGRRYVNTMNTIHPGTAPETNKAATVAAKTKAPSKCVVTHASPVVRPSLRRQIIMLSVLANGMPDMNSAISLWEEKRTGGREIRGAQGIVSGSWGLECTAGVLSHAHTHKRCARTSVTVNGRPRSSTTPAKSASKWAAATKTKENKTTNTEKGRTRREPSVTRHGPAHQRT